MFLAVRAAQPTTVTDTVQRTSPEHGTGCTSSCKLGASGKELEMPLAAAQNARMSEQLTRQELQEEAIAFRRKLGSVMLSTTSTEGMPDAGYAPCVLDEEGRCHVLISRLARHTGNLLSKPMASLMWIEDSASSRNVFARRRLILRCRAEHIGRDSENWNRIIQQMEVQLGNTVPLLAGLPDFMLFRFEAVDGDYVRGFAQAYPVTGNDLVMSERRTRKLGSESNIS